MRRLLLAIGRWWDIARGRHPLAKRKGVPMTLRIPPAALRVLVREGERCGMPSEDVARQIVIYWAEADTHYVKD